MVNISAQTKEFVQKRKNQNTRRTKGKALAAIMRSKGIHVEENLQRGIILEQKHLLARL